MEKNDDINLKSMAKFIKRRLPIIIIAAVLGFAIGLVKTKLAGTSTVYTAGAQILMDGHSSNEGLVKTYAAIVASDDFKKNVAARVDGVEPEDVNVSFSSVLYTYHASLSATSGKDNADKIVNAAADEFVEYANDMRLTEIFTTVDYTTTVQYKVLQRAKGSTAVVSAPDKKKNLIICTLGAIVLAAIVVVIQYLVDDRIRTRDDIKAKSKILGDIHLNTRKTGDEAEVLTAKISASLDGRKIVAIASPNFEKTEALAYEVAAAYGRAGKKALLVNADYRTNKASEHDNGKAGLVEALARPEKATSFIEAEGNINVLPRGIADTATIGADLQNGNLKTVFANLAKSYDVVVINAGRIHGYADALAIAEEADVNIMMVSIDKTKGSDFNKSVDDFAHIKVVPDGIVLARK